jgi:hypothetical protein
LQDFHAAVTCGWKISGHNQLKGFKMKIGMLGTGTVGETLGTKFIQLGHQVKMGSRTASNENAAKWVK